MEDIIKKYPMNQIEDKDIDYIVKFLDERKLEPILRLIYKEANVIDKAINSQKVKRMYMNENFRGVAPENYWIDALTKYPGMALIKYLAALTVRETADRDQSIFCDEKFKIIHRIHSTVTKLLRTPPPSGGTPSPPPLATSPPPTALRVSLSTSQSSPPVSPKLTVDQQRMKSEEIDDTKKRIGEDPFNIFERLCLFDGELGTENDANSIFINILENVRNYLRVTKLAPIENSYRNYELDKINEMIADLDRLWNNIYTEIRGEPPTIKKKIYAVLQMQCFWITTLLKIIGSKYEGPRTDWGLLDTTGIRRIKKENLQVTGYGGGGHSPGKLFSPSEPEVLKREDIVPRGQTTTRRNISTN